GDRYYESGQMNEAAAAYESALENKTTRAMRRHLFLYLGKAYESSGRPDKSLEPYRQAVEYDSKNWRRYRDLGRVYGDVKLFDEAIASFKSAMALKPNESSLLFDRGAVYRNAGFYGYAETDLKKALESGHDAEAVNREFSFVYEGMGRYADAARRFDQSITGS